MKPGLKPPGANLLILKYDELLSSFAYNFNLRRYKEAEDHYHMVGRCRLTLSTPRSKRLKLIA